MSSLARLLIADDEALVCIGLQSMLKWEHYGIEIVGTAHNGAQAEEMIDTLRPDIVIIDIKMPIKTGLQVASSIREKHGRLPLFIFLTSYEEFEYARQALEVQAINYLIKLELTQAMLEESIHKAMATLDDLAQAELHPQLLYRSNLQGLRDKFFIRLFNHLFESQDQYRLQREDLELKLDAPAYVVCVCRINGPESVPPRGDKLVALCSSTVQMAKDTLSATGESYIISLDLRHFAITLPILNTEDKAWQQKVIRQLQDMATLLDNYFNVNIVGGIGGAVTDPYLLRESYLAARKALREAANVQGFNLYESGRSESEISSLEDLFSRSEIRRAFEEMDTQALDTLISGLILSLEQQDEWNIAVTDAACNLLYMATSLLADGDNMLEQIFANEPEGYRSIYQKHTIQGVIHWLIQFRDGCCSLLSSKRHSYKQQVVRNVQDYIHTNLDRKLSLNQVADMFNFSPNYLSHLFSKTAKVNFVEYVTEAKITAAKEMMQRGEGRIYEISQKLGYESAFYFSKVFKKIEGVSPREYMQRLEST